ncbi:LysR family transcriptional regulator [Streptomyces sp. R11]|uniref:LysR family transcriptional regulator n=1 Tax=Streptomyces sp. R11 TaxID=3238625 RepID=A0AB39MVR7_9ACTN
MFDAGDLGVVRAQGLGRGGRVVDGDLRAVDARPCRLDHLGVVGSFTGAARTLGWTQSAVSRQISTLESGAPPRYEPWRSPTPWRGPLPPRDTSGVPHDARSASPPTVTEGP